jgi:hypothetical protein
MGVDWTQLAQERSQWHMLVNEIMGLAASFKYSSAPLSLFIESPQDHKMGQVVQLVASGYRLDG